MYADQALADFERSNMCVADRDAHLLCSDLWTEELVEKFVIYTITIDIPC